MTDADIAIVGGGMVGASLALGLTRSGFRVQLLEQRQPECVWPADSHAMRVSAITRASQHIFEYLGVWDALRTQRVTPYQRMRVWDAGGQGEVGFDAADIGEPDLGHIIENRVIQCALWKQLQDQELLQIRCPASVTGMDLDSEEHPRLQLADGEILSVPLVVAADGANSAIRAFADIDVRGWAYDQTAVVAVVRPELGHQDTAWQRFMPDGPLALLPLDEDLFSIVWSTTPEHAGQLQEMPVDEFERQLSAASEYRLGYISLLSERGGFPLRLQHATRYVRPGLALVGDAAHQIHPLAGQGVNLGLLDIAELIDVLIDARSHDRRPGSMRVLRSYERARKGDNTMMQMSMDGFKRLFGNELKPLQLLRNLGLSAVDRSGLVKDQMIRRAMGLSGELPSMAQPGWPADTPVT